MLVTSATKLAASFSNVKYIDIAPRVWLDPAASGRDIQKLEIFRSRLPMSIFRKIFKDIHKVSMQYGRLSSLESEEARSRFIAAVSIFFGDAPMHIDSKILNTDFLGDCMLVRMHSHQQAGRFA